MFHSSGSFEDQPQDGLDTAIAIVGLSCRFAGARTPDEFWANLRGGVESVATWSDEELLAAGVDPGLLATPGYVRAGAPIADMACFDAGLFGLSPRDAAIMDPQHRHFLECTWEALESAGHVPGRFTGAIGVFGGSGHNAYMPANLLTNPKLVRDVGLFLLRHTGNDKDFLTTRVSYLLDLKGPSVNVQTACSTSLVAVHMAAQSLLAGECDMAIAGGASIELPHGRGYLHEEGGILSPDGHCRPFDADSQGTVFGSGIGLVVLRRLADAMADGDHIYAVIRGSAVNNDGAGKVGYLAPSVTGHAQAVTEALSVADIDADTIDYVEAHGTGTPVGDPIEIAALTQAFRRDTDRVGYCGIGSVKANIGHTDTAAGTASLIKVAMALHHRELPPTLNHAAANPACELARSPFAVTTALTPWPRSEASPRRAGVSSLGVGGTNAHVVLEEAPARRPTSPGRAYQLLALSARSATALDANGTALADHLGRHPATDLADAAYTLAIGRQALGRRRIVVAGDAADAATALATPARVHDGEAIDGRATAFMFCGAGSQHVGMAAGLYESEPVFRAVVDECIGHADRLGIDVRRWLFPNADDADRAKAELERPSIALPALFTIQVALARLWMAWGVRPAGMIGHSSGEYAAAHIAGVIGLADAIRIVHTRGRLFESLPAGGMVSVPMTEDALVPLLGPDLSIAAINGAALCIASGPVTGIERLQADLTARGIEWQRVRIDVAAHSAMLDPVLDDFRACLSTVRFDVPTLPFVSNLTGGWISPAEATDPEYWVRHLREPVRFTHGLERLLENPEQVLLEVGPGRTMASLSRQHPGRARTQPVLNAMRHPNEAVADLAHLLTTLGRLWTLGVPVDWDAYWSGETRLRVPLPTYRFDRDRHWIEPGVAAAMVTAGDEAPARRGDIADWFYAPTWQRQPLVAGAANGSANDGPANDGPALVFQDGDGIGAAIAARLRAQGRVVTTVRAGRRFAQTAPDAFTLAPGDAAGYAMLLGRLTASGRVPTHIHHGWLVTPLRDAAAVQDLGFYSVMFLVQALAEADTGPVSITILSNRMQRVSDEEHLCPAKATVLGVCRTANAEYPHLRLRSVDATIPAIATGRARLVDALIAETEASGGADTIAWRAGERWVQSFVPAPRAEAIGGCRVRTGGIYLVTGGFGGLGLAIARHLATHHGARLALMARTRLPDRAGWGELLAAGATDDPVCRAIRRILDIETAGGQVMLVQADITDAKAVRRALRLIRDELGPIDGVFHAAGVLDDGVMQMKTRAAAAAVIAPKLAGTLALEQALASDPPAFMLLFSSVSAFAGLAGQADYAAANAFLDAYAESRRDDERTRVVSVGWSQWREVGMAARLAGGGDGPPTPTGAGRRLDHPFLNSVHAGPDNAVIVDARLSAEQWVLDEHRLADGSALIPGTGYLEIARAAHATIAATIADAPAVLSDVAFLAPFVVPAGTARDLRVHLVPETPAAWRFTIHGRPAETPDAGWTEHARGSIAADTGAVPAASSLDAIRRRCGPPATTTASDTPHLRFGPRWHNIVEARYGEHEALLTLELPAAFAGDLDAVHLHPALLDMASAGAQAIMPGHDAARDFLAPMGWGRLRLLAPLPARIVAHIRHRHEGADRAFAIFDVTIADPDGAVLAEATGFSMIRVADPSRLAPAEPAAAPAGARGDTIAQPLAIAPHEGLAVIDRVLAGEPAAHLVVSPADLYPALARLRTPRRAAPAAASADDAAAPRTATEQVIAELWCDMLGLDRVGRCDDFFDLGGHSLLAVQFVNRLRKRTGTSLPLAALLQGPTVERLAAFIDPEGAASAAAGDPPREAADVDAPSLTLVTTPDRAGPDLIVIRPGTEQPPLFIIHDGLGETLLYRTLANRLAPGRAVFGIEPRRRADGLFTETSITGMAADYVARIRRQYPHGPYLLAGLCAGGVIAFEVGRQLQDAGASVPLVAIMDAADVEADMRRLYTMRARLARVAQVFDGVRGRSPAVIAGTVPVILRKVANAAAWEVTSRLERRRRARLVAQMHDGAVTPATTDGTTNMGIEPISFLKMYEVAHRAHRPTGLFTNGDVVLFKATASGGDDDDEPFGNLYADRLLGWGKRAADDVELALVPGGHVSLLREPHVAVVAARLQQAIDQALDRWTDTGAPALAVVPPVERPAPVLTLAASR